MPQLIQNRSFVVSAKASGQNYSCEFEDFSLKFKNGARVHVFDSQLFTPHNDSGQDVHNARLYQ